MKNDNVFALFDTLNEQSAPLFRPKGGTKYLYVWDDGTKGNDWHADGYRCVMDNLSIFYHLSSII